MALMKLAIQRAVIIRIARLKPTIAYRCSGWQIAKNRSMEKATMVNTET